MGGSAAVRVLAFLAFAATFASSAAQCTCPAGGDAAKPACSLANLEAVGAGDTCDAAVVNGAVTTDVVFVNGTQNTATDAGIVFTDVTTWNGDVKVQSPGHNVTNATRNTFAMNDTVTITGDLLVSDSNIYTKVLLSKLKHVGGSLIITALGSDGSAGFDFEAIDLSSLETVTGDLKIHGIPTLIELHLPSFRAATNGSAAGAGGAMVFTGNHPNFTLTLPTCAADVAVNATSLAAMFSNNTAGTVAGVANVTVAKPKSCDPSSAAPSTPPGEPSSPSPTAENKTAGAEFSFSIVGATAIDIQQVKVVMSAGQPLDPEEDIVVTKVAYPVKVIFTLTAAVPNATVQDAVAKVLDVSPLSVMVTSSVNNDTDANLAEVVIYSSTSYAAALNLTAQLYASPATKSELTMEISAAIPGADASVLTAPEPRADITAVLKATPEKAEALITALSSGPDVEMLFTLLLFQAGVGGKVKIYFARPAAPLTLADEVLEAITAYPGTPAPPTNALMNGKYYPLVVNNDASNAGVKAGAVTGMVVAVACVVASLMVW